MEFRKAEESDLAFMAEHTISRGCFKEQPAMMDYVYALEHDGNLLAIGGVKIVNPWTAWAWLDLSEHAPGHYVLLFRLIREWLDAFMEENGIMRIMAGVETDFLKGIEMVEHLGFRRESIMEHFCGKKDAYCYVRIK